MKFLISYKTKCTHKMRVQQQVSHLPRTTEQAAAGAETAVKKWGGSCWTLHAERYVARVVCHYLGGSGGMLLHENFVFLRLALMQSGSIS